MTRTSNQDSIGFITDFFTEITTSFMHFLVTSVMFIVC